MSKKLTYLLSLSAAMLISFDSMAKMYKWVDEEGNTHYSQSPPLGQSSEQIAPPPSVDTESAQKALEKRREAFSEADEAKAKADEEQRKKDDELALKEKNCRLSKSRLDALQNTRRIRSVDDEGNVSRATEEERQSRVEDTKQKVKKWCN